TLGKTFAEMSVGLAVFDQNHRLVLFNPALIDLTLLGADFLSERPILIHFLISCAKTGLCQNLAIVRLGANSLKN
ncbi:MAG: hypothetical protein CMH03_07285, partial [Marinovum sp.]|nr:hypothetical protein [Marinovum sp.]